MEFVYTIGRNGHGKEGASIDSSLCSLNDKGQPTFKAKDLTFTLLDANTVHLSGTVYSRYSFDGNLTAKAE